MSDVDSLTDRQVEDLYWTVNPDKWVQRVAGPAMEIEEFDPWQLRFMCDQSKDIVRLMHRQSGKSTMASLKASHMAIFRPNSVILLISATLDQAGALFKKVRTFFKSTIYRQMMSVDNKTSLELSNGSLIKSVVADPWNARGYTADMIILDECAGISDDVFDAMGPSRLVSHGIQISMSTPLEDKGRFYEYCQNPEMSRYILTVEDNPRMQTPEAMSFLKGEKARMGSRVYGREYLCRFLSALDGIFFKRDWFKVVDSKAPEDAYRVRAWDLAGTEKKKANDPDWTAGVLMALLDDGSVVIEDVVHVRRTPQGVDDIMTATAEEDGYTTSIRQEVEGGSAGKWVEDLHAQMLQGYDFRGVRSVADKATRASPFSACCERGDVYVYRGPWLDEYLTELCSFPMATHDDQVDATSLAYNELTQGRQSLNMWML